MLLVVEDHQGVHHPAWEVGGENHQVAHEDPWGQEVLLEGIPACHLEASVLAQDSQGRVLVRVDHVADLVEATLLACLPVDH